MDTQTTMLLKHHFMVDLLLQRVEEVNVMQNTVASTISWIIENHLKMKDSKTEFIMYGSWQQLKNLSINSLKVNETSALTSIFIKQGGFTCG